MKSVTASKTGKMCFSQDTNWILRLTTPSWRYKNKQRQNKLERGKTIYSELAITRESALSFAFGRGSKEVRRVGKHHSGKKGRLP